MHPLTLRRQALRLLDSGLTLNEVSRQLDLPYATVAEWRRHRRIHSPVTDSCPRCAEVACLPDPADAYCYLLGLYLGDGHIVHHRRGVYRLKIACAEAWPGILEEAAGAIHAITGRPVGRARQTGCVSVNSYSKHWPHLFPQHGPGRKHERRIVLEAWQSELVARHPGRLVRGLVHSDGWRGTNRVRRRVDGADHWYAYPRYLFKNESPDIRGIYCDALDALGVAWRQNKRDEISVARREAVDLLDRHVGPKY
ncbi:helix-turn-helix domain-containing protein [Nonomuraea typhae]|uniref:Helix-turn-helix domain-containing protein n=1 Tax=Nonomuraea typhae TaxID=2603600 RepID=A0ABW7YPQ5_9ACTN